MEKLVAVRPDSTVDVEIKGVIFQVGIIPQHIYAKWIEIGTKMHSGKMKGEEMLEAQKEIVRFGVKGHKGLSYEDGEEVEFAQAKMPIRGKVYMVVREDILDIYYSSKIINPLSTLIMNDMAPKPEGEPSES